MESASGWTVDYEWALEENSAAIKNESCGVCEIEQRLEVVISIRD